MITDAELTLSNAQAVTVDAASTNIIDLTTARNLARSGARTMRIVALVTTTFATTVQIVPSIRQSANADMSSPTTILTLPAVLLANLTAGKKLFDIPFPDPDPTSPARYLDVYYDVTTVATAGAISTFIVLDSEGGEYRLGSTGLVPA